MADDSPKASAPAAVHGGMKVWLMYRGSYDDRDVESVHATEEGAKAAWEVLQAGTLEWRRAQPHTPYNYQRLKDELAERPDVHEYEVQP